MDKPFCSLPWDGIHIDQQLNVFFCCLMANSDTALGNLKNQSMEEILNSSTARKMRKEFLDGVIPSQCQRGCGTKTGTIVNDLNTTELEHIFSNQVLDPTPIHSADIRSSNLCTLDCVYCSADWSSTIAKREGLHSLIPSAENQRVYQSYIANLDLKHARRLFLAGGEPLLMKEYIELLNQVLQYNPECQIHVNTGLSVINTPVFALLKQLKNVTWIVSVDNTSPDKFAYIRHGNTWDNFLRNLNIIQGIDSHNIVAHMVYFALSYKNFDKSIIDLRDIGIKHLLIDPVFHDALDLRNLPNALDEAARNLKHCLAMQLIDQKTYHRLSSSIAQPFSNSDQLHKYLADLDIKYNMDSKKIFPEVYT